MKIVTALLSLLLMSFGLAAQNTQPLKSTSNNMVFVPVTVKGAKNAFAPGLKQEHFQVSEDGKPQQISFFSTDDAPWSIGIVVAVEGFLPGRADMRSNSIRDAIQTFQKSGNPQNKYWV